MRRNIGKKPWFYPLPVLIIGTCDENGVPDAMNAACGRALHLEHDRVQGFGMLSEIPSFQEFKVTPHK